MLRPSHYNKLLLLQPCAFPHSWLRCSIRNTKEKSGRSFIHFNIGRYWILVNLLQFGKLLIETLQWNEEINMKYSRPLNTFWKAKHEIIIITTPNRFRSAATKQHNTAYSKWTVNHGLLRDISITQKIRAPLRWNVAYVLICKAREQFHGRQVNNVMISEWIRA